MPARFQFKKVAVCFMRLHPRCQGDRLRLAAVLTAHGAQCNNKRRSNVFQHLAFLSGTSSQDQNV